MLSMFNRLRSLGQAWRKSSVVAFGAVILCFCFIVDADAHVATKFFDVKRIDLPGKGKIGPVKGRVTLVSAFPGRTLIFIPMRQATTLPQFGKRLDKEVLARLSAPNAERVVAKGEQLVSLNFELNILQDPKQAISLNVLVLSESGVALGSQTIDFYFQVKGGYFQRTTYEDLYIPRREGKLDLPDKGGVVSATRAPLPHEPETPGIKGGAVFGAERAPLHVSPKPAGSQTDKKRKLPIKRRLPLKPTEKPTPTLPKLDSPELYKTDPQGALPQKGLRLGEILGALSPISTAEAAQSYNISGRFSYRGLDDTLHPGWNWLVRLWWQSPSGWRELGARYINGDGTWSLAVNHSGYTGQNLFIEYRAGGYYLMPQDRNNNQYWWHDPMQNNIPVNFSIGHRVADTSNSGTAAGLGDVYQSAMLFWNAFITHGLNPERSNAIRLFFPNTWYDCGDGSGVPWSCASTGGDIWLIPAHTQKFTIEHELSHQLDNEYHNNQRPPGAGGAHSLDTCYNTGLAIREGFANAAPFFVLSSTSAADPSVPGGFEIEAPSKDDICNGDTNEVWVAGVFWDLMDHHADGQDILWFNNPAEVSSLYLNGGVKNGIKNYRSNYRNAASSGHQQYIDDIYENNTIPVP